MNLLFLTSRLPFPPNRGDKVRTFMFLKELSRVHKITLVSLIESPQEIKYKKELLKFCNEVVLIHKSKFEHLSRFVLGFFNSMPFQVNYYKFPKISKTIKQLVKFHKIELIYTHLIRMAPAVQDIRCHKILDYTDAISMEYQRSLPHRKNIIKKIFYSLEAKRVRRYEQKIISKFEEAWFISDEDINYLKLQENNKIRVVPNPVKMGESKKNYSLTNRIVFVGNMSVSHNIFAAKFIVKKIMPQLQKIYNDIEFHIIGAHPTLEMQKLDGINNSKVIGFVEDLFVELRNADIFVAPMFYSAGVQNKVLEAMAVGLPVITTENVVKSIIGKDKIHLFQAETVDDYIEKIELLLESKKLRKKIGQGGRNLIKQKYSLEKIRKIIGNVK